MNYSENRDKAANLATGKIKIYGSNIYFAELKCHGKN